MPGNERLQREAYDPRGRRAGVGQELAFRAGCFPVAPQTNGWSSLGTGPSIFISSLPARRNWHSADPGWQPWEGCAGVLIDSFKLPISIKIYTCLTRS